MLMDSHMHTCFSSDSETPVEAMIEQAIRLGIPGICMTDHYDREYFNGEFQLDSGAYFHKMEEMKEKYRDQIDIRIGVELGLQEQLQDWLSSYVHAYPFDFVIGSMHVLHGKDPYYPELFKGSDARQILRDYFISTEQNIDSFHEFQSLGHLDYLARYFSKELGNYSYQDYADEIDAVLKKLITYQIALEVNTAGYKTMQRPNPDGDVLRRYRELGGEMLTIGADAHVPEYIGYRFEETVSLLRACGFRYYTVFRNKKPQMIEISAG
ncbi:MAG: histidinol-phosphatase HisJ family protein [Lachnospiraceae bacterium]|nr:histidinol-phosphatase HisJ family protein [Lachnospiraceae bacterium]